MADDPALAAARELEERDERLAAMLAEVGELEREAAAVRTRAAAVAALLASGPAELEAGATAIEEAEADLARRRDQAVAAEREQEEAERGRDERRRAAAARAVDRTRDAVAVAERRVARAVEARAAVERALREGEAEVPVLGAQAEDLAARLREVPRISRSGIEAPEGGLVGVDAWASRVAAALFVVRSGLETERERLIREAQELATSVLGEHVVPSNVSLVRARLERR